VNIKVTVEGLLKAQQRLERRMGAQLNKALGKATIAAGRTLVKPMRTAAPRRSGALAKSVKATRARREDKPGAIVGPRIWYRHFVVSGTRRGVKPNPFVTRSAHANLGTAKRKFYEVLGDELNKLNQ
jgi:hypothetical protein